MKVFYDERQSVKDNPGISPSAGKPALAIESWQAKFPVTIMPVDPVTIEELKLVHDEQFVDDIHNCRISNGFGNKLKTIADSLLWTNGSFVSAAKYAAEYRVSTVSPTSGFHHATFDEAMGFCTYNGLALAAVMLKRSGLAKKVAIADIDMHYGNGTQDIIRELSLQKFVKHYSYGLYQWTYGNILPGRELLAALPDVMNDLLKDADILFYQAGADPHVDDPFGGAMTTEELMQRDRIVFQAAKDKSIPVVWNLAGGYQSDIQKVLEIHDNTARLHLEILK